MAQFKHEFVEDYIEIIAGYREVNGKSNHSIFTVGEPIISLARYDMKVVPSLAEQTIGGKGYTDRQAQLAVQLIVKYERQLFKQGIDITPVSTNPQYRLPLRELDRTTRAWVADDVIKLRFPYNLELIEQVRTAGKESKGSIRFNREERVHHAELTEWNVNWIYCFAKQNNFEIDKSLEDLMQIVLDAEKTPYKIELDYSGNDLTITNAPDSMREYVETHLGGFELDNILQLIDYAPILGYTVNSAISNDIIQHLGTRFWSLCANKTLKAEPLVNHNLVEEIVQYARLTNRFPIYVYEPDLSDRLKTEFNKYFPGAMMTLDNKVMDTGITDDVKVVYTTKIPRSPIGRIPMLISSAGMLFGGDRQIWIQTAEKIVYFTKDVYNKNSKGPDVCKLD